MATKLKTVGDVLDELPSGLALLRQPFPPHQISKLPKETGAQAKQRKADQDNGNWPAKCTVCGGYHHPKAVHLDYVGHAALTDRLLDADPNWSWEPMGTTPEGLPAINGGLWIKLTVCGVSRYGYGAADGKTGGDAVKEMIGDALRNAAMRFGAALDLWHKGDLHADDEPANPTTGEEQPVNGPAPRTKLEGQWTSKTALRGGVNAILNAVRKAKDDDEVTAIVTKPANRDTIRQAERDWPELITGDPRVEGDLGLKGYVTRRREELRGSLSYQLLVSTLRECETAAELQSWLNKNGEVVEQLDGEESRKFGELYDTHENALRALEKEKA